MNKKTIWFSLLLMFVFAMAGFVESSAQQANGRIELEFHNDRMPEAFKKLEKATRYKIMFIYDDVNRYMVNGKIIANGINDAMTKIIGNHPLEFSVDKQFVNVTLKKQAMTTSAPTNHSTSDDFYVEGIVVDENGDELPGVSVIKDGTKQGVSTNGKGEFRIRANREIFSVSRLLATKRKL